MELNSCSCGHTTTFKNAGIKAWRTTPGHFVAQFAYRLSVKAWISVKTVGYCERCGDEVGFDDAGEPYRKTKWEQNGLPNPVSEWWFEDEK